MPRPKLTLLPLGCALACAAGAAQAGLEVCNQTDLRASVAIGYNEDGTWTSEGWWLVDAGDCVTMVGGDLKKRYYYWHATNADGAFAGESYEFCVTSEVFTIQGDTDCAQRGYAPGDFSEADTGKATHYTIALDASKAPARKKGADAPAAPPAPDYNAAPGTYGEPYEIVAEFLGCQVYHGEEICEFRQDMWFLSASVLDATSPQIFQDLANFSAGTVFLMSGDLISSEGDVSNITIRDFDIAPDDGPAWDYGAAPGTYGEPYTIVAEFGGCWASNEEVTCEFYADGWTYLAHDYDPTAPQVIDDLQNFSTGSVLVLEGDMMSYEGSQARITIRDFDIAPDDAPDDAPAPAQAGASTDGVLEHMQGYWTSDGDSSYAWIMSGNQLDEIYDGNLMRRSFVEIAPSCAASDGMGPVIIAWPDPDEGDGPSCYVVGQMGPRSVELLDVLEGVVIHLSYDN